MSNSSLVSHIRISPNRTSPRNHAIDTITIHCVVGQVTVERLGEIFAPTSRKASCNYGIGKDGRIGMYCEEKDRSWCSSNAANDHRAITIEVASDTTHPYAVNDKAMASLINLCVDICKRNNIKKLVWSTNKNERVIHLNGCNMTVHRDYAAKSCPGEYLYNKHSYIANEVNKRLNVVEPTQKTSQEQFIEDIAKYVNKHREKYNIQVASPIIAQAILESASGTSSKAKYHNYFGLKYRANRCPAASGWFVDGSAEQLQNGQYVNISTKWFKFDNMEDGVVGYFQFINTSNYYSLKGETNPRTYLEKIKKAGYATSLKYVDNLMNVIEKYNLTRFDNVVQIPEVQKDTTQEVKKLYRVRKSWEDVKSQTGAYAILDNAKANCQEGYSVFDWNGKCVYSKQSVFYKVVKGDTLGEIAKKFNTTVDALVKLNGISNPNRIYVGQKIKIR